MLLTNDIPKQSLILEKNNYDTTIIMTGPFSCADTVNENGRYYPFGILGREVDKYQFIIEKKISTGELDHADIPTINLKNVSHLITKLWWEGKDLYGKLKVLSTPAGNVMSALVTDGVTVGISSRGTGDVKQTVINENNSRKTAHVVQENYTLITFDSVSNPSVSKALLVKEGKGDNKQFIFRDLNQYLNKLLTW